MKKFEWIQHFFLLNVNGLHKLVYVIFMSTNILRPEMVGDRINVITLWAKYHTVTYVLMFTLLNKIAKIETKAAFPHTGCRGTYIIKVHNLYRI